MSPVESHLSLRGARLFVKRWPAPAAEDAPTLVLLHDSLGSVRIWRDLPERLRADTGLPVLGYDRQGYGESSPYEAPRRAKSYLDTEADILFDLLAALGIPRAVLIGHSDGGTIALLAAAQAGRAMPDRAGTPGHPARALIEAIVVEAGHVFIEPITVKGIGDALEAYRTTDLKARLERYHGDKAESLVRLWAEGWTSPEFQSWNITPVLPDIRCPTLVIQGDKDEYATLAQVDAVVAGVRGPARTLVLPGIGHTPHREAPETVLNAMAEFIRDILP